MTYSILFLLIGLLTTMFLSRRLVARLAASLILSAAGAFCWLAGKLAFVVEERFWHDFVHHNVLVEPFKATAAFLAGPIDRGLIDGIANELVRLVRGSSDELRKVQTGYVRDYALLIVLGVVAVVAWFVTSQ